MRFGGCLQAWESPLRGEEEPPDPYSPTCNSPVLWSAGRPSFPKVWTTASCIKEFVAVLLPPAGRVNVPPFPRQVLQNNSPASECPHSHIHVRYCRKTPQQVNFHAPQPHIHVRYPRITAKMVLQSLCFPSDVTSFKKVSLNSTPLHHPNHRENSHWEYHRPGIACII